MTNSSPQDPQNPMPERRKRPATGVTFDEMIAIIVAFSTIGTILFWAIGGKNNKLANNLGLGRGNNLLTADKTVDTGLGFGNILSAKSDDTVSLEGDLAAENRRLTDELAQQETEVSSLAVNQAANRQSPPQANNRSLGFDSGANFAPLAGVATLPAVGQQLTNRQSNEPGAAGKDSSNQFTAGKGTAFNTPQTSTDPSSETQPESAQLDPSQPQKAETTDPGAETPSAAAPNQIETTDPGAEIPSAATPDQTDTAIQPDATPITPETTNMPDDVAPDYWAYPFVKAMREQALVPELAKNQEFEPDALITRASMATLVSQAFKEQPATAGTKRFKDVSNNNAIARDIDQAVTTGFMRGYSDDEFKPLENIPRYQVLVTLATGLGLKPSGDAEAILQQFGDGAEMPDWAKQQVAAAAEAGLVVNPPNTPANSLVPEKPATKAEVAAMIHQALVSTGQIESIESEYIVKP